MDAPADLVLRGGEIRPLDGADNPAAAVAIRDGRVVSVSSDYESQFRTGVETTVVDLDGRVVVPGFVDAHAHMEHLGRQLVHPDLGEADGIDDLVDLLEGDAATDGEWIQGYGYDESEWSTEDRYPTREDLDRVASDRPVVAFRVDMHAASVNSVALDRLDDLPEADVHTEDGEPTGVLVEDAAGVVRTAIAPNESQTSRYLQAAMRHAHRQGVTGVHDIVRDSHAPGVYRDLDRADELSLRVTVIYWADHLDAVSELGLRPGHGSAFLRVGPIKTYTDGSFGSRTAKLAEPYEDAPTERGTWVVPPSDLGSIVERATGAGFPVAAHAIGDEAIGTVIDAFEGRPAPTGRHRIEHAELLTDEAIDRLAASDTIASVQPNFHQWAGPDGLYEERLGTDRRHRTNRFRDLVDAGVPVAFGSDCMPLDPLYGIHLAVNAPTPAQQLSVSEAVRAYTVESATAGIPGERRGAIEPGAIADLTVLSASPWEQPESIDDVDVEVTIVDGEIVYDGRE